jgi:predicted transcriptional regulator
VAEIKSVKEMLRLMKVLSNPVRINILASLKRQPKHIYALAKELHLSYPLIHLYLESLEKAGLVEGKVISGVADDRERKIYSVKPFRLEITPDLFERLLEEPDKDG